MIDLARVAAVHPEDNSIDVVVIRTGARLAGVQVLAWTASSNTGAADLPAPAVPDSGDKWDMRMATARDMIAAIAPTGSGGPPICLGFLFPQVCQMLFKDGRAVHRHASDWYTSVDASGNFEASHPSGTFFRVGESADHEDLTGKDTDGNWKIAHNTGRQVHARLVIANGGAVKADLHIDPTGNVSVTHQGNLAVSTSGTAAISSQGDMTLAAPNIALQGNVAASGGALTHQGVNVGSSHTHGGVAAGAAHTTGPS